MAATGHPLQSSFRGKVIAPGDPGYDVARRVWNGMIDRRPAVVARCAGAADVGAALGFARERELLVAVRGGGHNVAGTGTCEGGIVIDLSPMREVRVDPEARTVWAQGGCTWGDVDRKTQESGLAVPGGVVSETGIAGLTLSGGLSHQSRAHGMTIDNLLACEVVTADGRRLRASEAENADLFWALRGGGGNFGVVTSFQYRAWPLGPEVSAVEVLYPLDDARGVLARWRNALASAPDEITSEAALWSFPAVPDVPAELHGTPFLLVAALYAGPPAAAERALQPLRELGTPLADRSRRLSYLELQSQLDPLLPAGRRYYWKATYLNDLEDEAIDLLVSRYAAAPSHEGTIVIRQLGGAVARVAPGETAFGDRSARFNLSIDSIWDDPSGDERWIAWTRALWSEAQRFSSGKAYFNFPGLLEEGEDLVRGSYGGNYDRLARVKAAYDPGNLFRLNQNIEPVL